MHPLSPKQLPILTLVYLALAAGGAAFLVSGGSPELVPAAWIALTCAAAFLFLWRRVDERLWRPFLWPGLGLAAVCVMVPAYVARRSPWAMTPAFLAPELPLTELVGALDSRLQTKARAGGRVLWWDEYPFNEGLADPVKVRLEDATGAADVILDRAALERELAPGQQLRMVGRIRKWEGEVIRFVALEVTIVDPQTAEED